VKIMKEWDPSGKQGPKIPLPDIVKIHEPKNDEEYGYDDDKEKAGKGKDKEGGAFAKEEDVGAYAEQQQHTGVAYNQQQQALAAV